MEIRFVDRMTKRPVRDPIARLDDRRESEAEGRIPVDAGQELEPDSGVHLKPTTSGVHCDVRTHRIVRQKTTVAIAAESVGCPLARWGEVELVVCCVPFHRNKRFETGVTPEICSYARHAWRRQQDSRNVSVETEGYLEFGTFRATHEYLNGANRVGACRWMAPEVDPVFDGHIRFGCGSGIALQRKYLVNSLRLRKAWHPKMRREAAFCRSVSEIGLSLSIIDVAPNTAAAGSGCAVRPSTSNVSDTSKQLSENRSKSERAYSYVQLRFASLRRHQGPTATRKESRLIKERASEPSVYSYHRRCPDSVYANIV